VIQPVPPPDQTLCFIALDSKAFISDEESDDEETNQVSLK